jgi:BarA-like signal transduction histidine kinase
MIIMFKNTMYALSPLTRKSQVAALEGMAVKFQDMLTMVSDRVYSALHISLSLSLSLSL